MAGIRVTPNQYSDITVAFLLDAMMHPDEVLPNNPEFHFIINKMQKAGLKSQLMSYYLDTSSITRGKYKVIRKSFTGLEAQNTIHITKSDDTVLPPDKKMTIRNIVKQTLRIIKSHKFRRNNGMPLNEETVDKIINKVLEKYDGNV